MRQCSVAERNNTSKIKVATPDKLRYFFSNFGPNSTTFILPSESFPWEVRSSLNGFCAAMGKFGAVVGSSMFLPLKAAPWTRSRPLHFIWVPMLPYVTYFHLEFLDFRGRYTIISTLMLIYLHIDTYSYCRYTYISCMPIYPIWNSYV